MANQLMGPVVAAQQNDDTVPREPPPPATPLEFPSCSPQGTKRKREELDIAKLLGNLVRTGPHLTHLEAFNLVLDNGIALEDLLPADFLPPTSWLTDPALTEGSDFSTTPPHEQIISNGRPAPSNKASIYQICLPITLHSLLPRPGVFYNTAQELLHDNGDAFRAARRQGPLPGRQAPRIVHSRKFWNALSDVAAYWDTSLDHYSDKDTNEEGNDPMDIDQSRSEAQHDNKMDLDNKSADKKKPEDNANATKTRYTGRRTDTGRNMPRKYREDMVSAFVEMLAWAFSCRLEQATIQPKLQLHGVTFPLPHIASVYRTPKDARKARSGILEGPILAVSCRDQTRFRGPNQADGEGPFEIMDLLRETGLMAMLAQKRAREGKEEVQPGAGKWWTTTPRWGGGPGGECGIAEEEAMEEPAQDASGPQRKRAKKATKADVWRAMQPPKSTWEKGIHYQQIGKDKKSLYDDIYLISSVNHHLSILHLRIHDKYVEYLSDGKGTHNASQQPWFELKMQRSKWFDLLSEDDRVQAMRGIWGIIGYLMRDTSTAKETSDPFI